MENPKKNESNLPSEVVLAAHFLEEQKKQEMLEELKLNNPELQIIEPPESEGKIIASKPELKPEPKENSVKNVKEV